MPYRSDRAKVNINNFFQHHKQPFGLPLPPLPHPCIATNPEKAAKRKIIEILTVKYFPFIKHISLTEVMSMQQPSRRAAVLALG